jgi:hypothetical protein
MSQEEQAMNLVLQRLGISVTQDTRANRGWGWSMHNNRLTRSWVGSHPTYDDAAAAALEWVLDHAWRGVLHPILEVAASSGHGYDDSVEDHSAAPLADALLEPWLRAFQHTTSATETHRV